MPTNTYAGIDLGTSGCRACAIDAQGNILAELNLALPDSHISGTQVEQNPQDWWNAVLQLLDTPFANHKLDIQTISMDGTSGTLLLCDRQGIPLTPGLMYNDTRAQAVATHLKDIAPQNSPMHSANSALAKLLHLQAQGIDATTQPRFMRLTAKFNVRGGIYTTVVAEHRTADWQATAPVHLP